MVFAYFCLWSCHVFTKLLYSVFMLLFSVAQLCPTLCNPAACQASLSFTISWSLLKLMSTESMMPSNHLILCCPLFHVPSIFPRIRIFSSESALHIRWPEYWRFSFTICSSNEYLVCFHLVLTPCSLISLQSKGLSRVIASTAVWKYQFFGTQTSLWFNSHICTWLLGKVYLWLDRRFLAKWFLLVNMLLNFVIAFLPKSKCLNFMAAVTFHSDFGAQENNLSLLPVFLILFAMKWWDVFIDLYKSCCIIEAQKFHHF